MKPQLRNLMAGSWLLLGLMAACATVEPVDPVVQLFQEGLRARAAEDYPVAIDKLEAATAAAPNNLRYGAEYRQAVIAAGEYDRCLEFLERLVAEHPEAPNAVLNLGYAYVDKVPGQGSVTQVQLANTAIGHFTTALGLEETWLVRYTRGNSYVFWPPIFKRTELGVADLERAIELAANEPWSAYHARAWVALGDAWWRMQQPDRAREIWQQGQELYPDYEDLQLRLSRGDEELEALLIEVYDPNRRVATDLRELWADADAEQAAGRGKRRAAKSKG